MSTITEAAEVVPATDPASVCQAVITFFGVIVGPCGRPSTGLYRGICVHEHVKDRQLCQGHADHPEAGLCRACYELGGGLSHECPINVAEVSG